MHPRPRAALGKRQQARVEQKIAGALRLVGSDPERAEPALRELLADEGALAAMRAVDNPYGDGLASERVAAAVAWRLGLGQRPADWR